MTRETTFFFDFDSTLIDCEALDILAEIKNNKEIYNKIKEITNQAMSGNRSFEKSLKERIDILAPSIEEIEQLKKVLLSHITPSIAKNKSFFEYYKDYIYIVSGGFIEYIVPVAKEIGINETHVFGNQFIVENGIIKGIDLKNALSKDHGKSKIIDSIAPLSKKIIIGDGYTDYEVFLDKKVDVFIAFAENVDRSFSNSMPNINKVYSLDEFIFRNNLTQ